MINILDFSPVACLLIDNNFNIIDCNEYAVNIFIPEYIRNDIDSLKKTVIENMILPETIEEYIQIATKEGMYRWISSMQDIDSNELDCEYTLIPKDDEYIYYIKELIDTQLVLQEEQKTKSLDEGQRAKSHFIRKMNYEIKDSVSAITNMVNYIMNKPNISAETKDDLFRIYTSSLLLENQVSDVVDISQINTQDIDLIYKSFNTEQFISDIARINTIKTQDLGLSFNLYIDRHLPATQVCDEHKLKQIINYFLGNTFKLTKEDKVCLTIQRVDKMIIYDISDINCGISEEKIERLYETEFDTSPFENNIMYILIKSMQGYIYGGQVANYTIGIPVRSSSDVLIGKKTALKLEQLTGGTGMIIESDYIEREPMPYGNVLIIDDIDTSLDVIHELLKPYHLQISIVKSTLDAIELITAGNEYDLIFMDSMMSDMDGLATIQYIKNMNYKKPVIIVTPNMFQCQINVFLENGFAGYLTKPIDTKNVDKLIKKYIKNVHKHEDISSAKLEYDNTKFTKEFSLKDAKKCMLALTEIIEQKQFTDENIELFADSVHAIKSSLSYTGFPHLSMIAGQIVSALQKKDLHKLKARVPNFLVSISKDIENLDSKEQDLTLESLDMHFKIIYDACKMKDIDRANSSLEIILNKQFPISINETIHEIKQALKINDYETAALLARKAIL